MQIVIKSSKPVVRIAAASTPSTEASAPAPTETTAPVTEEPKGKPFGGKNSTDPEHLAKMQAGRKAKAEVRQAAIAKAKAEASAILKAARAELAMLQGESAAERILDKARQEAERIKNGVRVAPAARAALKPKTTITYDNPTHAAFNYYGSLQGPNEFSLLDSIECATEHFAGWLGTRFKRLRLVAVDGFDYAVVLRHRATGQYVTCLAANGVVQICGYTDDAPEALMGDIRSLKSDFITAMKK